ncbi:MAG: sulfatase-like hydrolase/transferase [Promethearchaeota archaeon]
MTETKDERIIIFITIDALRLDHLNSYGYYGNTAPNLEYFARKGTLFTNAYTNGPETPSSFSSIFTSILPYLNGGYSPLPSEKITFPQILQENGIHTIGIHSNPNLSGFFNYNKGFDTFIDGERYKLDQKAFIGITPKLSDKQSVISNLNKILNTKGFLNKLVFNLPGFNKIKHFIRKKIPKITDFLLPFTPMAYNAPYIVNRVINILKNTKAPLFLWMHFMDVHGPYNPPSEYVLKFREKDFTLAERNFLNKIVYFNKIKISMENVENLKILYNAVIRFVDDALLKLFSYIQTVIKKDCLVIITADHGESFGEHDLCGHLESVYDELLKVPLLVFDIGKKDNVKKNDNFVQLLDIAPTILDYFGLDIPEDYQGISILSFLKGKKNERKELLITECFKRNGFIKRNNKEGFKLISIRTHDWKYILDEENNKEFLFDLKNDPKEKHNLIDDNKEELLKFRIIRDHHLQKALEKDEKSRIVNTIKNLNV